MFLDLPKSGNKVDRIPKTVAAMVESFKLVKPQPEAVGDAYLPQVEMLLTMLRIDRLITTTVVTDKEFAVAKSIAKKTDKEPLTKDQVLEILAQSNIKIDAADVDSENGEWYYWQGSEAKQFDEEVKTKLNNRTSTAEEDSIFRLLELGKRLDQSSLFWKLRTKLRMYMDVAEIVETYYEHLYFSRNKIVLKRLKRFFPRDNGDTQLARSFAELCLGYKEDYEAHKAARLFELVNTGINMPRPSRISLAACIKALRKFNHILASLSFSGETNQEFLMRMVMVYFIDWFGYYFPRPYPQTIAQWRKELYNDEELTGNPKSYEFSDEVREWYRDKLGEQSSCIQEFNWAETRGKKTVCEQGSKQIRKTSFIKELQMRGTLLRRKHILGELTASEMCAARSLGLMKKGQLLDKNTRGYKDHAKYIAKFDKPDMGRTGKHAAQG